MNGIIMLIDSDDKMGSRKNERVISGLSKEEISDKYLTLYDDHNELKRTARLQEDRIKRLASKVIF